MNEKGLPMLYHISGLSPDPDQEMGGSGFTVKLYPAWCKAVAGCGLKIDQAGVNRAIEVMAPAWLRGIGCSLKIFGARDIRVTWGEWGAEHITIPGNACGLDLADGVWAPRGGKVLLPHNVDTMRQAFLLLTVFLYFADTLVLGLDAKAYEKG